VLAAGEGRRLSELIERRGGAAIPKQFCTIRGGPSMLQETLRRAERVVTPDRIVTVVAEQHREWWKHDLAGLPQSNVVVQPRNLGTGPGMLLPLLAIAERDLGAKVVVLPSDHSFENENAAVAAVRLAYDGLDAERESVVLLGITPDEPDSSLGWILPGRRSHGALRRVERFVEKPDPEIAGGLMRLGGLWNSFILAARVSTLVELYLRTLPSLLEALSRARAWDSQFPDVDAVRQAYARLEISDFSRDVLERSADSLRVLPVPPCGWSDLGTPERLARCAARLARPDAAALPTRRLVRGSEGAVARPILAAVV